VILILIALAWLVAVAAIAGFCRVAARGDAGIEICRRRSPEPALGIRLEKRSDEHARRHQSAAP
jgi:hypothetical protein